MESVVMTADEAFPQRQDIFGGILSKDFKKDVILFTVFNETQEFPFSVGNEGELQFQCELRESKNADGESRLYNEFKIINFMPV